MLIFQEHAGKLMIEILIQAKNEFFFSRQRFVNFSDRESCNQAVEMMDNVLVNGYFIRVGHSGVIIMLVTLYYDKYRSIIILDTWK